jgi:hypothetical protein
MASRARWAHQPFSRQILAESSSADSLAADSLAADSVAADSDGAGSDAARAQHNQVGAQQTASFEMSSRRKSPFESDFDQLWSDRMILERPGRIMSRTAWTKKLTVSQPRDLEGSVGTQRQTPLLVSGRRRSSIVGRDRRVEDESLTEYPFARIQDQARLGRFRAAPLPPTSRIHLFVAFRRETSGRVGDTNGLPGGARQRQVASRRERARIERLLHDLQPIEIHEILRPHHQAHHLDS